MSDSQPPREPYGSIPPPPPRQGGSGRGCLKVGLIGCGVLVLLGAALVVSWLVWWNRNSDDMESAAATAAREGTRYGLAHDEQACFDEGTRRANDQRSLTEGFAAGSFVRACLEFSRVSPGFCDNVPPVTAIRRSMEWQQQRCGSDAGCRNAGQVVQGYCSEGGPKRTVEDTLVLLGDDSAGRE
ncbi:MAG TPA: hypothetical protein VFR37_11595 [Longimicrobium sp.]|nr:hypothetical protein [Longimicrobium sp.]